MLERTQSSCTKKGNSISIRLPFHNTILFHHCYFFCSIKPDYVLWFWFATFFFFCEKSCAIRCICSCINSGLADGEKETLLLKYPLPLTCTLKVYLQVQDGRFPFFTYCNFCKPHRNKIQLYTSCFVILAKYPCGKFPISANLSKQSW